MTDKISQNTTDDQDPQGASDDQKSARELDEQGVQQIIDGLSDADKAILGEAARVLSASRGTGVGALPLAACQVELVRHPGKLQALSSRIAQLSETLGKTVEG